MFIYFWILRLAALFGHKKARLLVDGQGRSLAELQEWVLTIGDDIVAWFHAATVGEFEQARPIIECLRTDHPQTKILLTFFSPSGYEMRKNYPNADYVFYVPVGQITVPEVISSLGGLALETTGIITGKICIDACGIELLVVVLNAAAGIERQQGNQPCCDY